MVQRVNIRLGGNLGSGGVEQWSIGLNFGFGGMVPNQDQAQEIATTIAENLAESATNLGTLANGCSTAVDLRNVEVYSYGVTGGAVAKGIGVLSPARSFTGTPTNPPQTTACITLQTALPGRSFRGRVYWPQLAPSIATDLKSSTAKDKATGLNTLVTFLHNTLAFYGPFRLCVYSPKLDVVTEVTALRSGDILDTQRRRRDALVESFTTVTVP